MFLYNPKSSRVVCMQDLSKKIVVGWVDKHELIFVRVFELERLGNFFNNLPTIYSKVVYDLKE